MPLRVHRKKAIILAWPAGREPAGPKSPGRVIPERSFAIGLKKLRRQSIAAGVFELKDSDENKWYRRVYLARVADVIYVLHCFTKNTAKTDRRDLEKAVQRWKRVQQRLREGTK